MAEPAVTPAPQTSTERRLPEALEFPGCRPVRISREDIADCDTRFEYRDADTDGWKCRTSLRRAVRRRCVPA